MTYGIHAAAKRVSADKSGAVIFGSLCIVRWAAYRLGAGIHGRHF